MRRVLAAPAVALAACALTAGCTVANTSHGGYDPNTLRIVLPQEPPTLEPCESSLMVRCSAFTGHWQPIM